MNKVFLTMFLALSLIGCSALSTVDAGLLGNGKSSMSNKDGTVINIDLNVPGSAEDYRAAGRAGAFGKSNDNEVKVFGNSSGLGITKGNKNKNRLYVDSSSSLNPNGDFATPSGRVTAEKISDNSGGTQSLLGNWE